MKGFVVLIVIAAPVPAKLSLLINAFAAHMAYLTGSIHGCRAQTHFALSGDYD